MVHPLCLPRKKQSGGRSLFQSWCPAQIFVLLLGFSFSKVNVILDGIHVTLVRAYNIGIYMGDSKPRFLHWAVKKRMHFRDTSSPTCVEYLYTNFTLRFHWPLSLLTRSVTSTVADTDICTESILCYIWRRQGQKTYPMQEQECNLP